ncbi:hypothetical protein BV20DRAFT_968945, partial [Pilatotrama ljubarskyi]
MRLDRGFENLERHALDVEEYGRMTERLCSFCANKSPDPLPRCSLCKSVRYCNVKCQDAHYKASHKRECAEFVHPPFTTAFMTQPLDGRKYSREPIFAHDHIEGMGCWVSNAGQIDGYLQRLTDEMRLDEEPSAIEKRQLAVGEDLKNVKKHKAFLANLLGVAVLVQNRRKDGRPMTVYGARTQVVCLSHKVEQVMQGKTEADKIATFESAGRTFAAIGVAEDPWTDSPRVLIMNFNGTDMKEGVPPPAEVHDAARGIVTLKPGDYVLLHMQFRIGDGDAYKRDWHAFSFLHSIYVAFVPSWPGIPPDAADRALAGEFGNGHPPAAPLGARFDHTVMRAHYDDDVERGAGAYMENHFGKERADMIHSLMAMGETMGTHTFGLLRENGMLEALVEKMKEAGMEGELPGMMQHFGMGEPA